MVGKNKIIYHVFIRLLKIGHYSIIKETSKQECI